MTPEVRRKYIKKAIERRKKAEDKLYGKPQQYTPVDLKTGHYAGGKNDPMKKELDKRYGRMFGGQNIVALIQKRRKDRTLAYNKANPR